jgi:peptide/nickel transport system substrate-binding protein
MRRHNPTRRLPILVLALLAALAFPATAAPRDVLRIGLTQYPPTLNPSIDAAVAKTYVLAMTRRPFTVYDADWKLVCMLCTVLPSIENGLAVPFDKPDGTRGVRLTFTIQPGATWGDGVPLTTEDVEFTWEVGRSPQSGVASAELYRRITAIEIKDSKTFTMVFDKLTFDYAAINDFEVLPAHLERAAFADPAQYRIRTLYDTDPTNPGLYFGPYRISEIANGSFIVLTENPTWWGRKPAFPRIEIYAIENTAALEANLLSGGLDMVAGELGLSLDQAIAFEKRHGDRFNVVTKPGLGYEHVDLNLDNPILADLRVRQALLYGIDRTAISRQLFDGRQIVADGFVSPLDRVFAKDVRHYDYDPAKARALLDDAGWRAGPGGMRSDAAGTRLALDFATTAGNRTRELVQQVLQAQWRQLGIDVRIKNEPARILFGQSLARRRFTMAMFAWVTSPENVPRSTLHSSEIPREADGWGGQNFPGFHDDEADKLIDAVETELDEGRRAALWRRLQEIYAEQLPELPLYYRSDSFVLPKWLTGVRPTGHQYPTSLWVEEWRRAPDGAAADTR